MGEATVGGAFITHEFDEAIAIQRSIVSAEEKLSRDHPRPEAKRMIKSALKDDQRFLEQLEALGLTHGATGKVEEVAGALDELMQETSEKATEAESEAYEAHAVLLNLKRKQQDSGAAMVRIARATKDTKLRDAALSFTKTTRATAQDLADELARFAVAIATADAARNSGRRSAAATRSR